MRRTLLFSLFLLAGSGVLLASSGESSAPASFVPPIWTVLPFAGILLSIAVCPLINSGWWEHNQGKVSAFWIVATGLCMALSAPAGQGVTGAYGGELFRTLEEYVSFIILLGALFVISGGIHIRGKMSGHPISNTAILGVGALLASLIGTTGASMLLIRPLLHSIRWRQRKVHTIIFFIFLVSNIGGALTPIGDPPLFVGFLEGVPFHWTLRLFPVWLLTVVVLLVVYYLLDRRFLKRDPGEHPGFEDEHQGKPIHIDGARNLLLLLGVLAAVILSGVGPGLGRLYLPGGALDVRNLLRDLAMLGLGGVSLKITPRWIREANHFGWEPIREVAYLFAGIFVAMTPSLMLLEAQGGSLGVNSASRFFWASGSLSSFLDNTPTYLTFLRTAQGLLHVPDVASLLAHPQGPAFLAAISLGSVFMGANTYIGNGPNFMVKAIAEKRGVKMPSFFGYMGWSIGVLIPLFLLVNLVFLR